MSWYDDVAKYVGYTGEHAVRQYQRLRQQGRTPAQALAYVWRTRRAHIPEWDEDGTAWNQAVVEIERRLAEETDAPVESRIEEIAAALGMPEDSRTVREVASGQLDMEEAMERAERIRFRHEKTEYDALLRSGVDRDTAREIIESGRD